MLLGFLSISISFILLIICVVMNSGVWTQKKKIDIYFILFYFKETIANPIIIYFYSYFGQRQKTILLLGGGNVAKQCFTYFSGGFSSVRVVVEISHLYRNLFVNSSWVVL